jgi:hypothetical protein
MATNFSKGGARTSARRRSRALRCAGFFVAVTAAVVTRTTAPADAAPNGTTIVTADITSGITLTGLTPGFTLTGAPGATVTSPGAVTYNVETNSTTGYAVTVQAEAASMLPAIPGNVDLIAIGALTIAEGGTGAYEPLSNTTPVLVHTQEARSIDGGDDLVSDFRIRMPVVDADTYTATLDYLVTSL